MKILQTNKTLWVLLCLALLAISGCSFLPKSEPVEGTEREQALAVGEPLADNLFKGLSNQDYAAFSRDFDETMKKAMDEKAFNEMSQVFDAKIGAYQSREVQQVERVENLIVITYQGQFAKEANVDIRLTYREGTQPQIAGLWFDSPKLREE